MLTTCRRWIALAAFLQLFRDASAANLASLHLQRHQVPTGAHEYGRSELENRYVACHGDTSGMDKLLAAAQGLDFRLPCKTSPLLEQARSLIRQHVQFFDHDRYFAPDIQAVTEFVQKGVFNHLVQPACALQG